MNEVKNRMCDILIESLQNPHVSLIKPDFPNVSAILEWQFWHCENLPYFYLPERNILSIYLQKPLEL